MNKENWQTKITTKNENNDPVIRGYNLIELIEKTNFTQAIYLVLKGELPNSKEETLMNAILVASIDHGVEAPSTTIARLAASNDVPSSTAIASGIASIGEAHGGAAESLAKLLQTIEISATEIVQDFKIRKKRIPGFGHKIYEVDPRTQILLKIAKETGFNGRFVKLCLEIEKELEKTSGRKLPLNIDGAIAALMSELGFDWQYGKSLFIISRVAGISAHVFEEQRNEKKVRRISDEEVDYQGPSERKI